MRVTPELRAKFLTLAREGFKVLKAVPNRYFDDYENPTCACAWGAASYAEAGGKVAPNGFMSISTPILNEVGPDYEGGVLHGFDLKRSLPKHYYTPDFTAGIEDGALLRKEYLS